jgi:GGDEF domain-containing protein
VQQAAPGFSPTASIGMTIAREGDTPLSLFDRADLAMYAAKQAGRDRVEVAS